MPVITRFAPSPTGMLHIGGARTALYNKLLARHHGGTFLVRIEDTDRKRSTSEAIEAIHKGLEWLGLEGDEAPVHQSTRADRHRECAERLVAEGKAYYCYASREEIDAARRGRRRLAQIRQPLARPRPRRGARRRGALRATENADRRRDRHSG